MRLGVSAAVVDDAVVPGDVEVRDGLITGVGLTPATGSSIAVPGFIDVHVHGYQGVDFIDADQDDHARIARSVTSTGVTAYQPTLISQPVDDMAEAIRSHPGAVDNGARVLGFHLEGPFLSPDRAGAHNPTALRMPSIDEAKQLLHAGPVAQMTLAPELAGGLELIDYLVTEGITVSLGHSEASAGITHQAVARGAAAFTHVFNAMRPMSHRDPGILDAALSQGGAFLTAVFDGVHLSDEAAGVVIRCAGYQLVAITDATAAVGAGDTPVVLGDAEIEIVDGVPRLPDGTIAGSILTMDRAFRNLLDLGVEFPAVARATSTAPALLAGIADSGTIQEGRSADLVVLDDGYEVLQTLIGGAEVFHS